MLLLALLLLMVLVPFPFHYIECFFVLVNVRENGELVKSRIIQRASSIIHYNMKYPEFDYHSLRHTHATMLAEADAPPKYVQERLGHKGIDVTMKIYQHLTKRMSE